eukprot:SAG31_NODE_918_length_11020_cov_14.801392_12_plen_238_part_00
MARSLLCGRLRRSVSRSVAARAHQRGRCGGGGGGGEAVAAQRVVVPWARLVWRSAALRPLCGSAALSVTAQRGPLCHYSCAYSCTSSRTPEASRPVHLVADGGRPGRAGAAEPRRARPAAPRESPPDQHLARRRAGRSSDGCARASRRRRSGSSGSAACRCAAAAPFCLEGSSAQQASCANTCSTTCRNLGVPSLSGAATTTAQPNKAAVSPAKIRSRYSSDGFFSEPVSQSVCQLG